MNKFSVISIVVCIFIHQPILTSQDSYFLKPPKIKVYSDFEEFRHMNRSLLELLFNATVDHENFLSNSVDPVLVAKFKSFQKMLAENLHLKKQVSSSSFDSLNDFDGKTE